MQTAFEDAPLHGSSVNRKDIPQKYKWAVEDIFPDATAWKTACSKFRKELAVLAAGKGTITNASSLLHILKLQERLACDLDKIYAYPRLQLDADNGNSELQNLSGQAETVAAEFSQAAAYIEPEIAALIREKSEDIISEEPELQKYNFYIKNMLRSSEHILTTAQEDILARSRLATGNAVTIFRSLVSADINFPDATDSNGNPHPVSEGVYMLNITSPDRELRRTSFENLMRTYRNYRNTLASTLTAASRSANFYATARKYSSTLEASLDSDNLPTSLYDGLIETIRANLEPLHEYMELKKTVLGLEELQPYDIYVPLTSVGDSFSRSFAEACEMVKQALEPLGQEYAAVLNKAFRERWIDIYENQGKRSGAYSWGVYGVHPFVLLNYQPRYNSISTIAHELGHALHSYFSSRKQNYINSEYTIFCAEVASTTNEIMLMDYAVRHADKNQRIYLLCQFLETVRTTVYRQVQFAEFEKFIHGEIAEGRSLQADTLDGYWLSSNKSYYGPALTAHPYLACEWSRIPHFYTPFYVYKYATGYSAATALAAGILSGQTGAVEQYLKFLASGGSDYSLNLLRQAGADLTTPQPITVTLQKFSQKLQELKSLL